MLADTGIVSVSGIVYDQAKVRTTLASPVILAVAPIAISILLPGVTAKSTSVPTVPLKAPVLVPMVFMLGPFTNCSPESRRAFPERRQTVADSVTSSVAIATETCFIADTPVGTTKLELTVLAKTADSAVKLVPIAVPVTVLQIVMLPIVSLPYILSFRGPIAPT